MEAGSRDVHFVRAAIPPSESFQEARTRFFGENDSLPVVLRPIVGQEEIDGAASFLLALARERSPRSSVTEELNRNLVLGGLSSSSDLLGLVVCGGTPIGIFWSRIHVGALSGRLECHIHEVMLTAEWRDRGLGAKLMAHLESCVRAVGGKALTLNIMADNRGMEPFYHQLGFRTVGYDFRKPMDALPHASLQLEGASPIRTYDPSVDREWVIKRIDDARLLCDFEQIETSREQIEDRLDASVIDHRDQIIVFDEDRQIKGFAWYRKGYSRLTKAPAILGRVLDAGEGQGDVQRAIGLLEAVEVHSASHEPATIRFSLWAPSPALLDAIQDVGFAIRRVKMRKLIEP